MIVGPIRTVAVVGAGPLAIFFVERCLRADLRVVLEDVLPANLRSASAALAPTLTAVPTGSLQLVHTVEDAVREADLAIDFVPDELESKLEIVSMADRMAPPRTIFCTPTEHLSITDLASCTYRPDRCFSLGGLAESLRPRREALAALPAALPLRLSYPPEADPAARGTLEQMLRSLGLNPVTYPDAADSQLTRPRP